jgi:general secretion pathway protein G
LMPAKRLSTRTVPSMRLGGWTFIETLIVIGIILILTSSVGFMAFKYIDQAKQATAKSQVETLALALSAYYIDCKRYPDSQQGLTSLWERPAGIEGWSGPYIAKAVPKDPWGHDYIFKTPGPNGLPFDIQSLGADGADGGTGPDADISSAK